MEGALAVRVRALETRAEESDAAIETLTEKVNEVRLGNATILKNLGVLMGAQGLPMVELTEDEADALFE